MTEAETVDKPGETAEEEDQPPIEEDEMADIGSVAEEIAAESADQDEDTEDEQPEVADSDVTEQGETTSQPAAGEPDLSVGDIYCNGLGLMAALGRTRYGTADEDEREELADEYADMARQIDLDDYLDQYLQQSGHLDELGAGQAVIIGSLMFGGMVMIDDPEMAMNAADRGETDA
jgi:hypothetical protein